MLGIMWCIMPISRDVKKMSFQMSYSANQMNNIADQLHDSADQYHNSADQMQYSTQLMWSSNIIKCPKGSFQKTRPDGSIDAIERSPI